MAPRSEADLEKIRNESRMKIMAAALELFARKGYAETTINEIAERAGVAKGLIYNYFTNKEELLYSSFTESFGDIESAFAPIAAEQDPCRIIELFIDGIIEIFAHDMDMWRLQTGIMINPYTPEKIRVACLEKIHEYSRFVQNVFSQVGMKDPESEAWVFAASLDGIMLYYLLWGDRLPLEGCRNILKNRYRKLIEQAGKEIE